jgi:hypothetical protein
MGRFTMASRTADHIAIAGGIVAAALLNALVRKGVLTTSEARDLMEDAHVRLQPFLGSPGVPESARIISEWRDGLPEDNS